MATIWKGSLTIGLVSVPVELKRAIRDDEHVEFHLLHEADMAPVKYERVCTADGAVVPWSEIVKGYEYSKGKYVVLTSDDFRDAALSASSTIEVRDFVPAADIDPRYFETPYFLVPGKGGAMAYAVVREAIRASETIGVGAIIMHQREHLAGLKAVGDALVLDLMRFSTELVDPDQYEFPSTREVRAPELAMAKQLIETLSGDFHPERYTDQYRANLMKIIRAKMSGRKVKGVRATAAATHDDKVVDLMARLRQSLEEGKKKPAHATRARKKTTVRRKKSA